MANKKTVVQMYEEILAIEGLTAEQRAFIEKRIEITKNKNAKREGAEPTPKQKEKMAWEQGVQADVLRVMVANTAYAPSDLVKLLNRADVVNTQKLTPQLTEMVANQQLVKTTVKGRTHYSLPSAEGEGEID